MKSLVAIAAIAALTGCYRTRFDLTPPMPEGKSALYDNHFHLSLINVIEISDPVDLMTACGGGPASAIEEETGVVASLANMVLSYVLPILHLKNATVMCGMQGGPMIGPPQPR
jgi:hypothetical protein